MNKIYKVIFNRNKNRYEIVSELASSRGGKCKVKAGKQIAKLFMTGLLATFLSSVALAADEEVKVKYDAATGTIKIVKADESQVLASYAVGGNISPITSIGTKNPTGIIAIGDQSKAVQSNSIAIGADAHAGDLTPAKDKEGKDKDYPLDNSNGYIAIGTKAVASGDRSIALGNLSSDNGGSYNIVQGKDSIGIGTSTSVFGYSGVSIGRRNIIGVPDPDLVKEGVLTTKARTKYSENDLGGNSVIVGAYNVAYGNRSNIIGTYSRAMGSNSVAIGSGVQSLSDGAIAIGKGSGYEFEGGSRFKNEGDTKDDYYGRDWELPPEYRVLKQVLSNDIKGDTRYKKPSSRRSDYRYENGGTLPKYNNYGAGSSDPGGFIVEGKNALGIGTYTQVRGDSAIGLATGEMTADFPDKDKDKSAYARDMRKIMDMEETLYDAKEALKSGSTSDKATLEANVKTAEESLATAKKHFRETYLTKYSFVDGNGALGVGRQILAQGDRSMAVGDYAKAISSDAIAYGGQTLANGTNSMAMGGNAHVGTIDTSFDNSMAIGSHTNVQAGNAVALGAFSEVTGQNSLALGFGKQSGDDITYNSVSGKDSTLIGSYGTIQGNNSILIGSNGKIANDRVVGLGNNINIAAADSDDQENNTAGSVFLGDHAGYVKDSKRARSLGKVTLVGSKEEKELTESLSSTKGALRDYTKDFIYIYMLENQDDGTKIGAPIAVRSDFAGGDSTVGVVSVGSTYEQTFENLGKIKEHHKKVGSLITVPVEVTVQVTKNGVPLGEQQQTRYFAADSTREEIYADSTLKEADKEKVWNAIQSKTSTPNTTYTVFETRRIQNVAPGLIGLNSTDAINGSQLFATNQMLGNLVGSLKKTLGDSVTVTEDGQITVAGDINTLGWIAKADTVGGSNGTVAYGADKKTGETEEAYQARIAKLKEDGYIVDAAKVMTFKAGKNIGLVQKPGELSISTIDTPSFTSVELRGKTETSDGKKVTEVTKIDSSGMKVVTETSTPASDGSTTPPTVTEKVSTTVGKDGVSTDGSVKVTNGTTDLVTIDKGTDDTGTDQEYGKIGLDGKNGSNATITVDRGTSSLDNTKNIGTDPNRDINENNPAKMDRITYTTKNKDGKDVITHEVATLDDGLFFSGDSADGENKNVKNKFDRKLSQETKIVGGVDLGLQADATAEQRKAAITDKLTDGNIGVISDGTDTLTVKLAKQLTGLDSTTYTSPTTKTDDGNATSTMKVDGNGVRFVDNNGDTVNNTPTFTTDGITGGNKTITDVASGIGGEVKDSSHNNANTFLENVNKIGAPTNGISENIVVNAKDLKNLVDTGFKLNTSGQPTAPGATTVRIGDTINVVNGANTKVSAIDDSTTGTYTFHIDVTGMPISYTDNQGNALTKIGDKYYKNTDIENGKPTTNATEVPADEVTNNIKVINKDGTTNNQGTISNVKSVFDSNIGNGADIGSKVDEIKDGSVISNTGSNHFINDLTKLNDQVDPKATDAEAEAEAEAEKIRAKKDEEKLNSVSTVRDLQKVALTPLFFEGDVAQDEKTANTFDRKLSEKTKIVGEVKDGLEKEDATAEEKAEAIRAKLSDGNIGVVSNGTDTLTIKLAKNLVNLTSVETGSGNNKTKMTENGITTTVKDGDTFKVTTTTPNGLATTEVKLDSDDKPTGESTTTTVTTDGVTITTQTPKNGDKPASTTETKLSKDGLATDGTVKVTNGKTGDDAKDLVTIGKGTETDQNATDKEFGTVTIDGKNGSNAILTVDRGTKSVTDKANILKDPKQPAGDNNPVSMDRLTYTTTGPNNETINHEVATLDDGFFLTTEHTEADKTRTVLFNNTIKVLDGANTKVSAMGGEDGTHTFSIDVTGLPMTYTATDANGKTQDVHKVGDTYTLADGTKLVQVGDKFYKPNQVEEVNGTPQVKADQEDKDTKLNNISLTSPVANTAPTLSNVGSALKKSDGTRITMSDLDDGNVYPTNNPIWNNAVNVGDLKAATDAARTEVTGTGKAIVTKKTGDQGQNIYNVHVDPIVDVVGADGSKVVRGDDGKYYNPTDIANKTFVPDGKGGGSWYNNSDLTDGKPKPDAKPQTIETANIKNKMVNPNSNDSIVLDNVKSGIGGKVVDPEHENKNTFMENVDTIGKANGISENTVVNAGDLKNLVDTGFKLNTSGHSGDAQTVKIGDTIQVVDGKNTTVSAITHPTTGVHEFHIDVTGLPVTYTATETDGEGKPTGTPVDVTKTKDGYQKADGTPLIKINENGKDVYYTADQLDNNVPKPGAKGLTITDNIRLINPKDGTGATKITNVAAGTDDTDAVNVSQLKQKVAAATTEVTGTGAAEVTKVTGADGQNVYNVHVDKLMEAKSTEPGKTIVRGSDNKYYYVDDALKQANDGKWYPADQVGADGKPADGAVGKDTTELTVVPADKLKNSLVNPNGNGPTIVDNVKSVLDGSGIGNGADMSSKIDTIENGKPVDTAGSNQFIKDLTGLNPTTDADKLNSVSTVSDLQKVALTPLFFEGDTAESAATNNAFGRKLSEKAKIVGGQKDVTTLTDNNIGVVSNGSDTLTVKLAKELTNLTSVTTVDETNGTKTTVSGKGITTDGKVVVNNGKTGDEAKEFVTIDKGTDGSGTDKEYGKIGLDGKNGSYATITIDRGTKSLNDDVNIGVDPSQPVGETNESATMDRITYTTTGPKNTVINHEVATLDDGFFLTTSKDVTDNKAAAKVKLNNTIKFTDGANTKVSTVDSKDGIHELHVDVTGLPMTYTVSQTGGTDAPVSVSKVGDTYQLADGTKLVKVGDKFYKPSQLVDPKADQPQVKPEEVAKDWTVNDSISLVNKDGSNNAPTTLKNVGSGLKDANGNSTTLDQAVGSNAVNVDDLRTLGKAATTEVTGTGAAEVTKVTGANGQNIYNVHVERFMQVAETDVEGNKVVKAADNYYYKEADIKDKTYIDGQWYNNTDIEDKTKIGDKWYSNTEITDGKANPGATELTVQATTAPNKAVGLQNNLVNPNDNTPTRLSNLASALSGEVGNGANTEDNSAINGIDKNGKPTSESGSNIFVKNVLDLDATEKTVEQLKTSLGHEPSEDEVKAEKARAEKDKALLNSAVTVADLQKTLQSPLFFEGDSADGVANENDSDKNTFARKLSQKTKIVGGVDLGLKENATAEDRKKAIAEKLSDNNIGVVSNGTDTLTIKLAKNLVNLTSVETGSGNNKTKMTENGITTTVKDGDTFKVTTTTPNGLATTEVKLDSEGMPKGESTTTMVTTDGVTITTQTPPDPDGDKPASTTGTKLSKNGLATDGTIKVTGDNAKDLVTIGKGTDGSGTDKEYGKIGLDGKNGSNATITVDRGTSSLDDTKNIGGTDPKQDISENNPAKMDRITYTTKNKEGNDVTHEVATLDDGFMLTTSTDIANSKAPANVKLNNTIKFTDGANTKVSTVTSKDGVHELHVDVTGLPMTYTVSQTGGTDAPVSVSKVGDTYQLANGTKLVKVDDKFYKPDQLDTNGQPNADQADKDWKVTNSISLVNPNGEKNAPTLKHVGSGLVDDAGNVTSLADAPDTNAVNVGDLKQVAAAAKTEVTGTGAAEVTKVTGADGQNIYNVHVDKLMTVKPVDANTNIARGGDGKYYNAGDIAGKTFVSDGQGGGSWYDANDVDQSTGKPKTEDDGITPKQPLTDQPQAVDQNMLKNSVVNPNGDGPTVLDNVKSGIGGKVVDPKHENKNTFMENVDTIGKANGISENTVVNAGDLKNLVDTGFKLNTSGHSGDAQTVKIGETIKVVDGANTKVSDITSKDGVHEFHIDVTGLPMTYTVSQTGNASTSESVSKVGDTYQLADGTKLVKVGDKFYKPSQLVDPNAEQLEVKPEEVAKDWSVNDSVSLVNKDGSTNAPTLKNVGSGLKDANGNATTLDKAVGSNAVNVDDLRTMGKAATTEVTGTGAAEVTKVTGANGQNVYNVHVDKLMTVKPVEANTNIARGGDGKYYNAGDIAGKTFVSDGQGGGSWYDANDVDQATGKPKTEDDGITPKQPLADQPQAVDQNMLKNSVVNPNGNDPTVLDNVKSGIGGDAGNGIKNGSTIDGTTGNNTFIENLDKVGKPANEGGIDKTTVVNAGDLKNLADTPLFFSGDSADGVAAADGTDKNTFSRKLSQETKIVGGVDLGLQAGATAEARKKAIADKLTNGNIGVISDGTDTLTIKLAKDLTGLNSSVYTSLTPAGNDGDATSSMKLDGNGIRFIDGQGKAKTDAPSLTTDGIKGGNKQITNIGSGLRDRQGKPVTLKNASEDILNNAVNVRDLRDVVQGLTDSGKGGGFGLTGNNGEVHKSLGETITLKGGIANKIENGIDMNKPEKATTDKNTYIDVKTSKNGSEKIMVVEIAKDLTDLNSAEFTDQEGNTTKMKGDGIYIDKNGDGNADISLTSEGLNNGGNKITNVADGTEDTDAVNVSQLNKLKQEIKQNIGDEINELNAYAPVVYSDKDGNRVIRKGNKFVKKNDETVEILPQDIRLSLVNADGKTTNPSTLQNVAKGVDKTDAVNVEQLEEATEKPLTFNGDAGSSSAKLGETVAIKGGANSADLTDNNIGVIANSSTKTLNVKLSKKLKGLESAEFVDNNGNTTNITGDGVHISGGNGSNVSLTSQGLNNGGNRITNVAPGVEATDAVNVSQLNQVGAALHNRINNVAKGAYGGVASAGAMASLPQAYLPGKSMVAAGASHYRGESAVALGASRISDNGKIILKLNASHNTSGNTMVGAGVGYQF